MAGQPTNRWGTRRTASAEQPPAPRDERPAPAAAPQPGIVHRNRTVTHSDPAAGYTRPPGRGFEHELTRATEDSRHEAATPSEPVYAAPTTQSLEPQRPQQPPRTRNRQPATAGTKPANPLMQPKILVPALIVVLVLGAAMGFTPGSGGRGETLASTLDSASSTTAPQGTLAALPSTTPIATATKSTSNPSPVPANLTVSALATQNASGGAPTTANQASIANPSAAPGTTTVDPGATNQVAGVQSSPTPEPTISYTPTQCGNIQETATQVNVEQVINGVSVKATQAAVYPISYLRCILMATGSRDSMAIAGSLDKAEREGSTHGAIIDLWVTNSQKDFAQVNLKTAMVAAVGQMFAPIATLNGRADLVISGGQGRSVGLVVALTQSLDASVGPMTVQIDAPMLGGKQTPGKYQLFLPTP